MSRQIDHAGLIAAAQREQAELRLRWLRDRRQSVAAGPELGDPTYALDRVLGAVGQEHLERALRGRAYTAAELARLPGTMADLARERVLYGGRRWLGSWLCRQLPVGSGAAQAAGLLTAFSSPSPSGLNPALAFGALSQALDSFASRLVELQEKGEREAQAQLAAFAKRAKSEEPAADTQSSPEQLPPEQHGQQEVAGDAGQTLEQHAEQWLEQTQDAMRELTRWLLRRTEVPGADELSRLLIALRCTELDGLARQAGRFFRVSEGARRLGFERDMNARMRGETGASLLLPVPVVFAIEAPRDVRVVQSAQSYGIISDVSVAQGLFEGLMLALISPEAGPILSRPRCGSLWMGESVRAAIAPAAPVSAAVGATFAQLRADASYLRRVDAFEADAAEKAGRHAAVWFLLRLRLAAALTLAWRGRSRSVSDRLTQLSAAGERALGRALPASMVALTCLGGISAGEELAALSWGLTLHAALRERFDEDYFVNPRLGEVLRGAAARGAELDAAGFAAELGVSGSLAAPRLFELLS